MRRPSRKNLTPEEKRELNRLSAQRSRARQRPDQLGERRRRDRERRQRVFSVLGATPTTPTVSEPRPASPTPAPTAAATRSRLSGEFTHCGASRAWGEGSEVPTLRPVSAGVKADVLQRLRQALGPSGLDELVCAMCDCFKLRKSSHVITLSDAARVEQLRVLLASAGENLPLELLTEYDCSDRAEAWQGVLLSKRGVRLDGSLNVCGECYDSLSKQSMPKFAIKNGFYMGSLPSRFADITLSERLMTQTVSVVAVTRVMRGGAHRAIRSHCLAFDSTPGPAATLLPTSVNDVTSYRVVLAGPFTSEQQARVRRMHRVCRQVVEDVLQFYCQHNHIYGEVAVDCSGVPDDAVPENLIYEDTDADVEAAEIDADHDRVGSVSDADASIAETDVIERRVVFVSEDREVSTQAAPPATDFTPPEQQSTQEPQFLIRHSSQFAAKDNLLFARMFPHLFPYGRGHPGEHRHVAVSLEACIRHYGQLSSRKFAEDELFMLASFDYMSLQRMYKHVALKCQRNPTLFEPYSNITEEALMEALKDKELRRQGRTASTRSTVSTAKELLKTVELSGGTMWGSDAERAQCRRKAFAYQSRYGQPALFVTLTPNVADSFVLAQYTGITSVDTLFDANLVEPSGRSALHSASLRNDVTSAKIFMRNMDAFIEHALGVAPKHIKGKPFDGLFGKVKAYFGMVETQGGGTLHAHFLIWLEDAPPNSEAFDRAVAVHGEDQFARSIETFADSVVSTTLPLSAAESSCVFCGHGYADLKALPLPQEALENPDRLRGSERGEPLLVQCEGCKRKVSSQHILRRILLANRPASWPPPMREPSTSELDTAVRMEISCRGSVSAAKRAVYRRDELLAALDSDDDRRGDYLRTLNNVPARYERRQDDAFRDDEVARAVEMTTPSLDDARWTSRAVAFAVSILVFMLNLHWWSHAGSCFKKSRAASAGQCRYGFPRARIAQTKCTSEGVEIQRHAPFEYVNGFNAELMLTFKCNHDIQVMVGGPQALLRIYYATKYVTKMQSQIDSITAVALAAFKRRQLREARDAETDAEATRSTIGRRRVVSLLFAITNRREIAGPLAVVYLMRGSCAYMSTPCATLPLRDVLHELIGRVEHPCDLVELEVNGAGVTFEAASFLDDYRYRPAALDHVNLYEYVMAYFRRKKSSMTAPSASFLPGHPLVDTHCVGTHSSEVVPVVAGMRMPYLNDESPREIVVKRCQCALVLFKAFRSASDLVTDPTSEASWIDAYSAWIPTRTSFVKQTMANMDNYHLAAQQAKEREESSSAELELNGDNDGADDALTGTRDDVDAAIQNTTDGASSESATAATDNFLLFDDDGDESIAFGEESALPVFPSAGPESAVASCMYQELLTDAAQSTVGASANLQGRGRALNFPIEELRKWVNDTTNEETDDERLDPLRDERPTEIVELITNALQASNAWTPPTGPHDQQSARQALRPYAAVNEVSAAFTLNRRQHLAFTIVANALLRRFLQQELASQSGDGADGGRGGAGGRGSEGYRSGDYEARLRDDQLLMYLGGAGGTGKSRVVDAVTAFCASWHRECSAVKTALTGKAATLISRRTLKSFIVRLQHAIKNKSFMPLDLLIIDEVSMMSKSEWLQLDKLLRRYMQVANVPFGGIHVLLVGDFLQMPPVNADPIYLDVGTKPNRTTADTEGFELWRRFRTVVVLEESVRFRADPEWGEGCEDARYGQWSPEFIRLINSRVIQSGNANQSELQDAIDASAVFVTPENVVRQAVNNAFIFETAARMPSDTYPIRVLANFKGELNKLSPSDRKYVFGLPDNRFGRMAPYLDLVIGMPIQVTQNVATGKGVANGTLGTLVHVHFPDGTEFRCVRDQASGMIVQMPSKRPDYAIIRVPRPRAVAIRPNVNPDLFPVFFDAEAFKSATIVLSKAPDGSRRSITVRPKQFPFVCAVGSTVYKVQGETLKKMVVLQWKSRQAVVNKPQQTYLHVSRVTSRDAFVALQPFTAELAAWSKPPANALNEEERLKRLSDATIAAHQASTASGPVTTSATAMEVSTD